MYASPKKVGFRRMKRQFKAAFAIGVALAAGAFLACQKTVTNTKDAEADANGDANVAPADDKRVVDASLVEDGGVSAPPSEDASSLLTSPVDAGKPNALTKKVVKPQPAEARSNPRARSARLRVAERRATVA